MNIPCIAQEFWVPISAPTTYKSPISSSQVNHQNYSASGLVVLVECLIKRAPKMYEAGIFLVPFTKMESCYLIIAFILLPNTPTFEY